MGQNGIGTYVINNNVFDSLGVKSEEELYQLALANTKKIFTPEYHPLGDVVNEMMLLAAKTLPEGVVVDFEDLREKMLGIKTSTDGMVDNVLSSEMFVLKTKEDVNGSVLLLIDNVLSDFADFLNSDFYIIPSSIHELIAVPANSFTCNPSFESFVRKMIKDVNKEHVAKGEFLSDNLYIYRKDTGIVEIVPINN
jgi:hypothetical protein